MKNLLQKYMAIFTTFNEEDQLSVLDDIVVQEYKKGTTLLRQGDVPDSCYFVLQGCVRQYSVDESGKEVTSNFFTEEQAITIFNRQKQDKSSAYSLTCLALRARC
ncbi:cyclic nucleotide-binding domain-containing protein [Cohnella terricola]|uniref:Cyclic nucleotide-binding domain-containing protein n=1 Tax=Cohnella terricola TaxID=1289167 RepID=A0A559JJD1_9BACL|nr:cyclic nucleotide-binding domain-containing protein [Cohnella terricola]